jgi:hypothetical protein
MSEGKKRKEYYSGEDKLIVRLTAILCGIGLLISLAILFSGLI